MSTTDNTSEEIYGVVEQPGPVCPFIDEVKQHAKKCKVAIRRYKGADREKLMSVMSDMEWELEQIAGESRTEGLLEDLRRQVRDLRAWGEAWKQLAIKHAPIPDNE